MANQRRPRVAVVFGGRSSEHAVSVLTAGSVLRAIDPAAYDVLPIGIAQDGRWVLPAADQVLELEGEKLPKVRAETGTAVAIPFDAGRDALVTMQPGSVPTSLGEVDVVLPLLHGPFGEDGTLQGLLELAGIRYVGAGVFASAASMDKAHMKLIWAAHGLPVGDYVVVTDRAWRKNRKQVWDEIDRLGLPVFVKPSRAGSSMGITRIDDRADLEAAIETAREHDPKVIIEAMVPGREIECGVLEGLDDQGPEASLPGEVIVDESAGFYDFAAKYISGASAVHIPADLPDAVMKELRAMAVTAFETLDCEGLARVDFFYTPDGRLVLNEINTMPGFTPTSAFPKMWAASGLDYPALIDRLLRTALNRRIGLR